MHVREARPSDVDAVRAVHRASIEGLGPAAYAEEQVEAWAHGCETAEYSSIAEDDCYFVVAEDEDGGVVGFGSLRLDSPEGYEAAVDAEVTGLYVHPSVTREGVGSAILADLEDRARNEGVRTLGLTSSLNAVPFYEAQGYERVREYAHEFSDHESTGVEGRVVEMRKEL